MGAATFNLFYSFLAGLLMFIALYGFALWATKHDPDMLRILLSSSRFRPRYDPLKHTRFDVEVRLGKDELLGYQASSRGGIVRVQPRGEPVLIAGKAVTVLRGELVD